MSLKGSSNSEKIWNYFKEKGFSDYGIAGLLGNLDCESGLNPKNLENAYEKKLGYSDEGYCAAVDNGSYLNFVKDSAGWGLCQWTYHTRKKALYDYAKSNNMSIGSLEMQLDFLYKELSENYKSVLNTLKTAKSVKEASNEVLLKFERPADQSVSVQNKRASYGQKYYDKYAKNGSQECESVMGVKTYQESSKVQLSKNFNSYEFRCGLGNSCSCSTILIDDKLVEYLQKIRDHFGKPVKITSAYRCDSYNKSIGGATGSYHSKGMAVDIVVEGVAPKDVAQYAESIGIEGIGLYETSNDGYFVHIDTRTTKSFWYGQAQTYRSTFGGLSASSSSTASTTQPSSVSSKNEDIHKVRAGETLSTIAAKYGMTYQELAKYNNISNPNVIRVGQEIKIPSTTSKIVKVKVTADLLNVRAGNSTNYKVITTVKKGSTHELLDEKNGWGKIAKGWISLNYVEKV